MCGIFCLLNYDGQFNYDTINEGFQKGKKRGPEFSTLKNIMIKCIIGFHRLAINGLNTESNQPIILNDVALICNGEIYNYKKLYKLLDIEDERETDSDCEIIIHLYLRYGMEQTLQLLDGVFSFVLVDFRLILENSKVYVARDPYGVRPLFMLSIDQTQEVIKDRDGLSIMFETPKKQHIIGFASELKSLSGLYSVLADKKNIKKDFKYNIHQFEPGTYSEFNFSFKVNSYWEPVKENVRYFNFGLSNQIVGESYENIMMNIQKYFIEAVYKRCETTDRPIACLLSGGLDSSLVASIVNEFHKKHGLPILETYSIGVKDSTDLCKAKIVADYLGTKHTEIILEESDFFKNVKNVIHDIESYDTTTVRASIGNWLLGKYISKNSEAKVIFNGDGADELMGGYLYTSLACDCLEFDKECKRLLTNINYFDVLRSDRCISSHGLEPRTPFLDRAFTLYYLSIPPEIRWNKHGENQEKHLIRNAFSSKYLKLYEKQLLPDEILFRKKEAFSDGVSETSRSLYSIMKDYCYEDFLKNELEKYPEIAMNLNTMYKTATICDKKMNSLKEHNYPKTAEEYYYRKTFEEYYKGLGENIPYFWMPKYTDATDSSARTLDIYKND